MNTSRTKIRYPFWEPQMVGTEAAAVCGVIDHGFLNDGDVTTEFERRFAAMIGAKHAVAVTSGTAALFLALVAAGIGPGDEVLVPDVTFVATANAVTMAGATPVLVDVNPATLTICPAASRRAITPKTRAILPVHVSGRAADMSSIVILAEQFGLAVIEDAAEAFLSKSKGRYLGTIGLAGCFSLSPNKTITTGQGGVVVTNSDVVVGRLRELKDQGRPARGTGGADVHATIGFNFKFTNLQAAVGLSQLDDAQRRADRLVEIYRAYERGLRLVDDIQLLGFADGEVPQWIDAMVTDRAALDSYLLARGAQGRAFWHPVHTHVPYQRNDSKFTHSTRLVPQAFWLPSAFTMSDQDVRDVCAMIETFGGLSIAKAA